MSGTPAPLAGVELGGTKCIVTLATGPDDVRDRITVPTTHAAETLAAIGAVLARWKESHGIAAIGIASFGPLDLDRASPGFGSVIATPKPGWAGTDLTGLARDLGLPFAIDTDVNGAALAEGQWGAARGLASWAYVTVGTGIGVGSIVAGRPLTGLGHSEAGHMRVPGASGGACPFHDDCVEGIAAGPGIAKLAGRPSTDLAPDDPVWERVIGVLAAMAHNLVLTSLPERILIGGGVATGQPHLLPRLRRALVASLAGYASGDRIAAGIHAFIQPPALGAMAGPLGSIALARRAARS